MLLIILLRMWRERRLMLILFTGLCLVTSFLSLGPLYVRAIAAAEFETQLNRANVNTLRIDLVNEQLIAASVRESISNSIGARVRLSHPYMNTPGAVCGFQYNPDNPAEFGASTTTTGCYFAYAYPDLNELFTLVNGRLPENDRASGRTEAAITATMQEESGWEVGKILIYGEDPATAIYVEIVGVLAPILSMDDPFWAGQFVFEEFTFFFTDIDARQERGLIVTEADFMGAIQDAGAEAHHNWRIVLDRRSIRSSELAAIGAELNTFSAEIREDYPSMEILSTLDDLLRRFEESVAAAQPPITFLSLLILVLLVYNMVAIAGLIQEQQMQEWVMFASRGGSRLQLLSIQFVTVGLLNGLAVLLGPLLASALLYLLTLVGPQAAILSSLHIGNITPDVLLLSAIAGIVLQIALMLPAWNGANDSLLRLKREISRPTRPLWLRYNLDVVLILAGMVLLARLYGLASGTGLETLLVDPTRLFRVLAAGNISAFLNDPFSLIAPILLVIGLTLFWMRLFPLLIGALGRLADLRTGLLLRLALWNVERDPSHYARMVLLLIGTVALGTSSLILSASREVGAWGLAQNQVGADAAVTVNLDTAEIDWQSIPNVEGATSVFLLEPETPAGSILIGVRDDATNAFPQIEEVAPFVAAPEYDVGGLLLPAGLVEFRLDVFAEMPAEGEFPIRTGISVLLQDRAGRDFILPLTTENSEQSGTFVTFRAEFPSHLQSPITFQQFLLTSEQEGQNTLRHMLYIDHFRGVASDGSEVTLLRFEPDTANQWSWMSNRQGLPEVTLTANSTLFTESGYSLQVQYVVARTGALVNEARLGFRNVRLAPIPVILSPQMAEVLGQRNRGTAPLQVGDTETFGFDVLSPDLGLVKVELLFSVVGIRASFNTAGQDGLFLIADRDLLQRQINAGQGASLELSADVVWLQMVNREPSIETINRLNEFPGIGTVTYAWDVYNTYLREPLTNAISGILFAGFWVSLLLSLIDFAFYLAVTLRQRAASFATLQALGWDQQRLPQLLLAEQVLFVAPALMIGVLAGLLLAGLILPFLSLTGTQAVQFPVMRVLVLLLVIVVSFTVMLLVAAVSLRRREWLQMMRFGD